MERSICVLEEQFTELEMTEENLKLQKERAIKSAKGACQARVRYLQSSCIRANRHARMQIEEACEASKGELARNWARWIARRQNGIQRACDACVHEVAHIKGVFMRDRRAIRSDMRKTKQKLHILNTLRSRRASLGD